MTVVGLKEAQEFRKAVFAAKRAKDEGGGTAAIQAAASMVRSQEAPPYSPADPSEALKGIQEAVKAISSSVMNIEKMMEARYEKVKQDE